MKDLLEEQMEDEKDFQDVLSEIRDNPEAFHRVEPPMGYEQRLLSTLRERIQEKQSLWQRLSSWTRFHSLATGACALAFVMTAAYLNLATQQSSMTAEQGVVASLAEEAGQDVLDEWAANMGDYEAQRSIASDYSSIVAMHVDQDPAKLENFVEDYPESLKN